MKTLFHSIALLFILALLLLPIVAFAQEATQEAPESDVTVIVETSADEPIPTLPEAFNAILFAAPLVTLLVAVLKRYIPLPAAHLNFYLSLMIFSAYQLVSFYGGGGQFEAATGDITSILQSISHLVLGVGGTYLTSAAAYHASKNTGLPLVGYERPRD
jgi:hypothetical protein